MAKIITPITRQIPEIKRDCEHMLKSLGSIFCIKNPFKVASIHCHNCRTYKKVNKPEGEQM